MRKTLLVILSALLVLLTSSCNIDEVGHSTTIAATNKSSSIVYLDFASLETGEALEYDWIHINVSKNNEILPGQTESIIVPAFQYPLSTHQIRILADGIYFHDYDCTFKDLKTDGTDKIYIHPNLAWIDVSTDSNTSIENITATYTDSDGKACTSYAMNTKTYENEPTQSIVISNVVDGHIPIRFGDGSTTGYTESIEVTLKQGDTNLGTVTVKCGESVDKNLSGGSIS